MTMSVLKTPLVLSVFHLGASGASPENSTNGTLESDPNSQKGIENMMKASMQHSVYVAGQGVGTNRFLGIIPSICYVGPEISETKPTSAKHNCFVHKNSECRYHYVSSPT